MTQKDSVSQYTGIINKLEREIASSHRSMAELQKEKLFSETLLDSLPGIFYLYDEDRRLLRWNKNHETLTGFGAGKLRGMGMGEWFSGEDQDRIAEVVGDIFTRGCKRNVEASLIVSGGRPVPYLFTGARMTLGSSNYLLGVGLDLSEKRLMEDNLRKSEEKYRAIFENAVEGIFQTTMDGRIVSANPAMARILGWDSPEEMLSHGVRNTRELYVSVQARHDFISRMNASRTVSGFETQFRRRDGSKIWVSLHARQVLDHKGLPALIEGIVFDITRKRLESDALRAREQFLSRENLHLRSNIRDRYRFGDIIGKSPAMQEVYDLILKAAASEANVIIYGESGTGKELVAQAIHKLSQRRNRAFVPVNCGAVPENLLESEFFGYSKGAFTGADANKKGYMDMADGGVLFLDELGEIGASLQVKLLRVLEGGGFTPVGGSITRKPDVRIIAATNRDLDDLVRRGIMREDFFYRIHIIPVRIPPLRERRQDIPLLIEHFMHKFGAADQADMVTAEMMYAMEQHDWPGNIRELQNVLHRCLTLDRFDLARGQRRRDQDGPAPQHGGPACKPGQGLYHSIMERHEREVLLRALEANRWNRAKTAQSLGLPQRTFFRKLRSLGLIRQ